MIVVSEAKRGKTLKGLLPIKWYTGVMSNLLMQNYQRNKGTLHAGAGCLNIWSRFLQKLNVQGLTQRLTLHWPLCFCYVYRVAKLTDDEVLEASKTCLASKITIIC